jgi:hypothetical protein
MKKKNRYLYILFFIISLCYKEIESSWAIDNSSCFNNNIVDISEQEQEERINEAELDCLTQQINDDTGNSFFLLNDPTTLKDE